MASQTGNIYTVGIMPDSTEIQRNFDYDKIDDNSVGKWLRRRTAEMARLELKHSQNGLANSDPFFNDAKTQLRTFYP